MFVANISLHCVATRVEESLGNDVDHGNFRIVVVYIDTHDEVKRDTILLHNYGHYATFLR